MQANSGKGTDDADLAGRLSRLDTCVLSDALDVLGLKGVVSGIRPMWEGARLAGPAVTVKLAPGAPDAGHNGLHLGVRAIEQARRGDVVVVDNDGRTEMGGWGGLLCLAASLKGLAGVVVDGACRDIDEARTLEFSAFARSGIPRTARGRVFEESSGQPVRLGGITVSPGDFVIADGSGVVIVPRSHVADVVPLAEQMNERERDMAARLKAGEPASNVLGSGYESMISGLSEGPCRHD
jgi:4-hydroxy-4-methyl-2-oxoglutarate aldolase